MSSLFCPNYVFYRKMHKPKVNKKIELKVIEPSNINCLVLKVQESGNIKDCQLLAAYRTILKRIKGFGTLRVHVFPNYSITKKPNEVRMGKGKGNHAFWVSAIKAGRIVFELRCTKLWLIGFNALNEAARKLPLKSKVLYVASS